MGGLQELLPDDANTSSSSSSQSTSNSSEADVVREFHSDKGTKRFTEKRWNEVKQEIIHKSEYSVGEVETLPADKRFDVLHEMSLAADDDRTPDELEHGTDVTCQLCGTDCSYSYVPLDGETFCYHHPLIQVADELGIELEGTDN